jgi:hypothetical protein
MLTKSVNDRPRGSTDQAATMSSSAGIDGLQHGFEPRTRLSRPLAPLMPASS